MTSSAISAQGSTLQIGTSTAGTSIPLTSATVSASAAALTTLFTSTAAHGLASGQSVVISGCTGTGAALVNTTFAVSVVSPTTFTVQVNTFGLTVVATSAAALPTAYVPIANVRTYNGLDGQASEIDVTNLASLAKEIRLGLVDFGQIQTELDHNAADPGQARALQQYNSGALTPFNLTFPNGTAVSFNAFVRKFSVQGGVDQVVRRQMDLRVSGQAVWC